MALAKEFQHRAIKVYFAMKEFEPELLSWVSSNGIEVFPIPPDAGEDEELGLLLPFLLTNAIRCVIIDHHTLGYEYSTHLRKKNLLVVHIDDEGTRHFCSDLLINYNIYAPYLNYKIERHTKCLLGPQYTILRKPFGADVERNDIGTKLLVTMGGGYARGEVIKVIKALEVLGDTTLRELEPEVILGAAYPSPESVISAYSHLPIRFHYNLENIRAVMERSRFAVSGGGGILYELSRMGLPSIIIVLDENQKLNAHYFDNCGISKNLGWYEDVKIETIAEAIGEWVNSSEELEKRRKRAAALVDGKGTARVADSIFELLGRLNAVI